jgi:hypothetical protein
MKKICIHEKLLYVKNLAKRLHKRKMVELLFKFGIRKALTQ